MTLKESILIFLKNNNGATDREITNTLKGKEVHQAPINQACRQLSVKGFIDRRKRDDGKIGNYLINGSFNFIDTHKNNIAEKEDHLFISEDYIKTNLENWLQLQGWNVQIAWGNKQGIDILATKNGKRWIVEVKGQGTRQAMRVNFFLHVLGELLQRMDNPNTQYSIALPEISQYRNLWNRLPYLAKMRMCITALFVDSQGNVIQEKE